jgi:protein-S-isoprenylcysteine O-methyltransferase Ste14
MTGLNTRAWLALIVLGAVMSLLLFVPAGTVHYWQAWVYWALIPSAAMIPFLIWRLFDEERFLATNLSGYIEYQKRVRHRLVPFVW